MPSLTWSLVVPTFNRREMLREALRCAVEQTRPPAEVVVVDSSPDAADTRDAVAGDFAHRCPDVPLIYLLSENRSSAIQRNEGLPPCTGDILYFIDDDTLLYPDFAETILRIFEADAGLRVAGVQGSFADTPFPGGPAEEVPRPGDPAPTLAGRVIRAVKRSRAYINWGYFLPYFGRYPARGELPPGSGWAVDRPRTLDGGFMAYRREVIQTVRFDPDLLYYATGEDQEASYRASFLGALLRARNARAYHCEYPADRPNLYRRVLTKHANSAFWIQKHNPRSLYVKLGFFALLAWNLPCRLLDDLEEKRWTFPRVRGLFAAAWTACRIFLVSPARIPEWYRRYQVRLEEKRRRK